MQKWEYAAVTMTITNVSSIFQRTDARLFFFGPAGHRRIDIKQDKSQGDEDTVQAVFRIIAQLGMDGWELAASQGEGLLYFKRPLSGEVTPIWWTETP